MPEDTVSTISALSTDQYTQFSCSTSSIEYIDPVTLNETDVAAEADYCEITFPDTLTEGAGQTTDPVFGQIFENGATQPAGAPPGVSAQLGLGPQGTDPTTSGAWSWFPMTYNTQVLNNDEFSGTMTAPAGVGTYPYAVRFSPDAGVSFTYCDANGAGSNAGLAFSPADTGTLTVTP